MMTYLPLLGILVIVVGFVLRFNPLLVVAASALVTGLAAGSIRSRYSPRSERRSTTRAMSAWSISCCR